MVIVISVCIIYQYFHGQRPLAKDLNPSNHKYFEHTPVYQQFHLLKMISLKYFNRNIVFNQNMLSNEIYVSFFLIKDVAK